MKNKAVYAYLLVILLTLFLANPGSKAQEFKLQGSPFETADVSYNQYRTPRDIRLPEESHLPLTDFLKVYNTVFELGNEHRFRKLSSHTDRKGHTHTRMRQFYKGVEVAEVQMIVHERKGMVYQANGNAVHGIRIDVTPSLRPEEAGRYLKKLYGDQIVTQIPAIDGKATETYSNIPVKLSGKPRLMISTGGLSQNPEDYRLVYRFDVYTIRPTGRYDIDIDAHTGALVGAIPRSYTDNIKTRGVSQYNDTVDITIVDNNFLEDWAPPSKWHIDDWQAFGDADSSWWMADTTLGDEGGYANGWYEVLQTEPVILSGSGPELSFFHRYAVEPPEDYEEYDGWDGMNIRVSTDGGESWEIIQNPVPGYNCTSLFSFGYQHNEGPGIPGWGGIQTAWTEVTADLSPYQGDTVMIRFAFASDPGYSTADGAPELFGWQIDDILITSGEGELYINSGSDTLLTAKNLFTDSEFIEGAYRLRETERGNGIATFNGLGSNIIAESVDYVEEDTLFDDPLNEPGVSLHWAVEQTYDYFLETHNRRSYDDQDSRIYTYANWVFETNSGTSPNNAMWLGNLALFGAGDSVFYNSFATIDITAHELAHGVTEYSAGLIYQNEPGALNESFSDIFGAAVEFYAEGSDGDWLMGEDMTGIGDVIRSMMNPKELGDPDTYLGTHWVQTTSVPTNANDYGGVHTNSGVQNYWFYLLSAGGNGTNDHGRSYSVTGIGIADAEQIAYHNLTSYLTPTSGYLDAAYYSLQSAVNLFGEGSQQHLQTANAWEAVGIYSEPGVLIPELFTIVSAPGITVSEGLIIRNSGMETLEISSIEIDGEGFSLPTLPDFPVLIDYSESFEIDVAYYAKNDTGRKGNLYLYSNDPNLPVATIALDGITLKTPLSGPETGNETGLGDIFPNPFHDKLTIPYELRSSGSVVIRIYNNTGKLIWEAPERTMPQGKHLVTWQPDEAGNDQLPSGVYRIVMITDEGITGTTVVKY